MTTAAKIICAIALGILFTLSQSNRPDDSDGAGSWLSGSLESIKQSVLVVTDVYRDIAGAAEFFEKARDGEVTAGDGEADGLKIYRWQDANGNWFYSDSPPAGVNAEVMTTAQPTVMSLSVQEEDDSKTD